MRITPIALWLGLGLTPGLGLTARAAEYDLTVLQDPGGVGHSGPTAINASGQSVGYSWTANNGIGSEAVLWSPSGKATVLQNPTGPSNNGTRAINASGQSVGYSGDDRSAVVALGKPTVLQNPPGQSIGIVWAISAAGQSAGDVTSNGPYNTVEAVLWSPSGAADRASGRGGLRETGRLRHRRLRAERWIFLCRPGQRRRGGCGAVVSPSGDATVLQGVGGYGFSEAPRHRQLRLRASGFLCTAGGCVPPDAVLWSPSGTATLLQDAGGHGLQRGRRHQRLRAERWVFLHRAGPVWAWRL